MEVLLLTSGPRELLVEGLVASSGRYAMCRSNPQESSPSSEVKRLKQQSPHTTDDIHGRVLSRTSEMRWAWTMDIEYCGLRMRLCNVNKRMMFQHQRLHVLGMLVKMDLLAALMVKTAVCEGHVR